jgi:hypothetical protein
MKTKKVTKPSVGRPDEYYSNNAFELARFGNLVMLRNILADEDFEKFSKRLAQTHPDVCRKIDSIIEWLKEEVIKYSPLHLMSRAYTEWSTASINKVSEADYGKDDTFTLTFMEYVQSLIVSIQPSDSTTIEISDSEWDGLKEKVKELFQSVNFEYQVSRTAYERECNPEFDLVLDEFKFLAQAEWTVVRGHRYMYHEKMNLEEMLSPHSEVFMQLFRITVSEFIEAAIAIQTSLSSGLSNVFLEFKRFQQLTMEKIEPKLLGRDGLTREQLPDLMEEVLQENGWEKWRDELMGKIFGTDLFDIQMITRLPALLLDRLSYSPGEEIDFFSEGQYSGWPLREWPTFRRPFLKIDGRYYCFHLHSLFDKLYRIIQRIIFDLSPDYRQEWNAKQRVMSESVPFNYFKRLLPSATIYRNVYYKMKQDGTTKVGVYETDGVVIFGDCLIIVEIKAGAFTYTSPATDFDAFMNSIKNLVFKPSEQGKRLLDCLKSDKQVVLYDSDKCENEITTLSFSDFRNQYISAITLDQLTSLASKTQHLVDLKQGSDYLPIWTLSLNDLRVYSDIFDNPLIFMHYLEHRIIALNNKNMTTFDELDHIGLYLTYNAYSEVAKELSDNGTITWQGFVKQIDRYFHELYLGTNSRKSLRQDMPKRLEEIINVMAVGNKPHRRQFASILLNTDGEWRKSYSEKIEWTLEVQRREKRLKPISCNGQLELTTFCWQSGAVPRESAKSIDHTQVVMVAMNDKSRWHLELEYDNRDALVDFDFQELNINELSESDMKRLKVDADVLKAKRVQKVRIGSGKIGRNDLCPCGSGKKFKCCCGKQQ